LLDYFNPSALAWWHSQLDLLLVHGADGWKIDGSDPYVLELIAPRAYGGRVASQRCL
jgi:alpha-glucosidase (family GH31 glycosyl hydrolase)